MARTISSILVVLLLRVLPLDGPALAATSQLGPVGLQYFGLHIHRASNSNWPQVPFGAWRLWDARVTWADLEPRRGEWDFSSLDRLVGMAREHGVEVLLPLGMTPEWASARPGDFSYYGPGRSAEPKNLGTWRLYVRKVAERYKGMIRGYEIWNEPNEKGFFSGSPAAMLALASSAFRVLKEVDPTVTVVSPSSSAGSSHGGPAWLEEYLALGGGQYADVIGYHFYVMPDSPEKMLGLIARVRQILSRYELADKPLWNTEAGWNIVGSENPLRSGVLDKKTAAAYLARSFLLNRAMGVERFYWYAWDNGKMGLASTDGHTVKDAPVEAFRQVADWMIGRRLHGCKLETDSNWVCRLDGGHGKDGYILWSTEMGGWQLPADWKGAVMTDLSGQRHKLRRRALAIGPMPILLEPLQ